jgi:molybdopterin/thiamine biosynthesis adenylyltransferase
MSRLPTSRSRDLQCLVDEGYEIEIREGYLLLHKVPYLDAEGTVRRGTLASPLELSGDETVNPVADHTVHFTGDHPHDESGRAIDIVASGGKRLLEGVVSKHLFSRKPPGGYPDYYEKMTTYIGILSGPAQCVDSSATAITHGVVATDEESVFEFLETASSRAGVSVATGRLRGLRVAIVGLGGSGAYILDLIAKTPVAEIHLYDGDVLLQHNAFRSPGAASIADLRARPYKVDYYRDRYSSMRRQVIGHAVYVDDTNVDDLAGMDFVFVAVDRGSARRLIVERLQAAGVALVDVGMGVWTADDALGGQVRTTASTPEKGDHIWEKVSFADEDDDANRYRDNIQIADLNMLNAALAVIKWKKLCGFYVDIEGEHHSVYDIDGNFVHNEDGPGDKRDGADRSDVPAANDEDQDDDGMRAAA